MTVVGTPTRPGGTAHHLTHGVTVWLCATHQREAFRRRRGGREFTERLGAVWAASGAQCPADGCAQQSPQASASEPVNADPAGLVLMAQAA